MIKCCIFDLDGTVLDTINTITHYVNVTFEKHGIEKIDAEECKYFAGDGAKLLIDRALFSKGITDAKLSERLLSEYNGAYNAENLYLTEVFDGISELIGGLKANGIKIALLSNKPDKTVQPIIKHFFDGVFDLALGAVEDMPLKPDPTVAKRMLSSLGIRENETAWIGDTSTDVKTAKNLGVALNIGVLWGFRGADELTDAGADVLVTKPSEIFDAVIRAK